MASDEFKGPFRFVVADRGGEPYPEIRDANNKRVRFQCVVDMLNRSPEVATLERKLAKVSGIDTSALPKNETPGAPEAPIHFDNYEASSWQSGWTSGYEAGVKTTAEKAATLVRATNLEDVIGGDDAVLTEASNTIKRYFEVE